jgi:hypothetical protein
MAMFQVLPQQVLPVVIAIGCPDHDMDVEFLWLVVVQEYTLVHVKLDEHYRTVYRPLRRTKSPKTEFLEGLSLGATVL